MGQVDVLVNFTGVADDVGHEPERTAFAFACPKLQILATTPASANSLF